MLACEETELMALISEVFPDPPQPGGTLMARTNAPLLYPNLEEMLVIPQPPPPYIPLILDARPPTPTNRPQTPPHRPQTPPQRPPSPTLTALVMQHKTKLTRQDNLNVLMERTMKAITGELLEMRKQKKELACELGEWRALRSDIKAEITELRSQRKEPKDRKTKKVMVPLEYQIIH